MVNALRAEYPKLHLTVVLAQNVDLMAYADGDRAAVVPIDKEENRMSHRLFFAPARRMLGNTGALGDDVVFRKFLYEWRGKEYILYSIQGHNGYVGPLSLRTHRIPLTNMCYFKGMPISPRPSTSTSSRPRWK